MKEALPKLFRPLMQFNIIAMMVIVMMFSVFNVFSIVKTQQRQRSLQALALQQASSQMEDFLSSAEHLGVVIQGNSSLMAHSLYKNMELPHNIVRELEMLAPSINSLSSLSIVYINSSYPQVNDIIYSSSGRYSYKDYCQIELNGSMGETQLKETIVSASSPGFVLPRSGKPGILLYIMPIPSSYIVSPGRIILRLDYTSFTRSLRSAAGDNSDLFVFDPEGNLLLYFGPSYENDIAAAREAQIRPDQFHGKTIFEYELESNGLRVVQTIDFWQYYQPTFLAVFSLFVLAGFLIAVGIRFSYMLASSTAKPFYVLVQRASQLSGVSSNDEPDEIARLSHVFEDLVEQQNTLNLAMENRRQLEESQYLLYLLGAGEIRDFSQTVVNKYDALLTRWMPNGIRVLVFRFDDTIHFVETYPPEQQWTIKSNLRKEFSRLCDEKGGFGAAVSLPNGQGIAAIISFSPSDEYARTTDSIREALCRACGLSLSCGISTPCQSVSDFPDAFQQARSNCRYRLFHANSTITPEFAADMRSQRTRLSYMGEDEILQAVKACSHPGISRAVSQFFADITQAANLPSYKLAYFNMLSHFNKLIPECGEAKQNMLVNMLDLLYENCYESTDVLQRELYEFCILLSDTLYAQRSVQINAGLMGTIYAYVEEHYASPTLSLSSIADALCFSPSYLTRYFKEKSGMSLMQYIDRKRFEESKRLLTTTSLSVKSIVEKVGYTDEANFSRKFKKNEGVTPTQYRSMKKEGSLK